MDPAKKASLDSLYSLLTSKNVTNHHDFSDGYLLISLLNLIKEYSTDTEYAKPIDRFCRIEDIINTCYNMKSEDMINYGSVMSGTEIDSELETYALCLMAFGVCLLSSKQSHFMKIALNLNSTLQAELMQMTSAIIQPNSLQKSNLLILQHSLATINENEEQHYELKKSNSHSLSLSMEMMNQSSSQPVTPPLSLRNSFTEDSCTEVQQLLQSDCQKSLFCNEEMHWSFTNASPQICPPSPLTPLQNFLNSPHIQLRTVLREQQRELKAKQREVLAERQLRIEAEEELVEARSQIDQMKATNREVQGRLASVENNFRNAEYNLAESNSKLSDLEKKEMENQRLREKLAKLRESKEHFSAIEKQNEELLSEREELQRKCDWSAEYHWKLLSMEDLEKSLKNLSSAESELREMKVTLVEAESQIKNLLQERDDAIKTADETKQHCCELQTELSDSINRNYLKSVNEPGVNLAVDIKLVDLEEELQSERKLRGDWEQKYRSELLDKEALQKSTDSLVKELAELRDIANKEKSDLQNSITRLMEDKTAINKELLSIKDDKKALTIMKKDLESKLQTKDRTIEELTQQHGEELARLNKTICNYQDEIKQLETEFSELQESLKTTETSLEEAERAKRVAEDEKNAETVRCEAAILAIQTECTEEIAAMREELDGTRASLANEVIELNSRLEKSAAQESELEQSVTELNENLQHEMSDRSRLETEVEQLAAELNKMESMREGIMMDCENEVKVKLKKQHNDVASTHDEERKTLKEEIQSLETKLFETASKYDSTVVDLSVSRSDILDLKEKLSLVESEKQAALDDLNKTRIEWEDFSESIENLVQVEKKWVADREEWDKKEKELLEDLAEAKRNAIDGSRLQEDANEIQRLKQLQFDLEEQLESLTSTNKRLQGQVQCLDQTNDSLGILKKLHEGACVREREANGKVKSLQTELQKMSDTMNKQRECLDQDAKLREDRLRADIKNAQSRISTLTAKIQTLDEENASLDIQVREWRLHAHSQDERNKAMENELQRLKLDLETKSSTLFETLYKLQSEQAENDRNQVKCTELEKELSQTKQTEQEAHNELMTLRVRLASLEAKDLVHQGIRDRQNRFVASNMSGQDLMPPPINEAFHRRSSISSSSASLNTYSVEPSTYRYKENVNTNNSNHNDSFYSFMESSRRDQAENFLPDYSPVFSRLSNLEGHKAKAPPVVTASGDGINGNGSAKSSEMDGRVRGGVNDGAMSEFSDLPTSRLSEMNDEARVRELLRRNKNQPVHMRTCYPVETQVYNSRDVAAQLAEDDPTVSVMDDPSVSEDLIRSGQSSGKSRRKFSTAANDNDLKSYLRTELSLEAKKEKLPNKDSLAPIKNKTFEHAATAEFSPSRNEYSTKKETVKSDIKNYSKCENVNPESSGTKPLIKRSALILQNDNSDSETLIKQHNLIKHLHQRCELMKQLLNQTKSIQQESHSARKTNDGERNELTNIIQYVPCSYEPDETTKKRPSDTSEDEKVVLKFSKTSTTHKAAGTSTKARVTKTGPSGYTPKNIKARVLSSRYHHCCKTKDAANCKHPKSDFQ